MPGEIPVENQNGTQEQTAAVVKDEEARLEEELEVKQANNEETKQESNEEVIRENDEDAKQENNDEVKRENDEEAKQEVKREDEEEAKQESNAEEVKQETNEDVKSESNEEVKQENNVQARQQENNVEVKHQEVECKARIIDDCSWVKKDAAEEKSVQQQNGAPKKSMSTSMDTEAIRAAYEDVRSDGSNTQWAVLKFNGPRIVLSATGVDFDKFRTQFQDNERVFGYIRIQTGDEMSKRQKFLLVTWVGPSVSVLQRAKMSIDKAIVKNVISNFAVELQLENTSEIDLAHFVKELNKAGGANYGTGVREI